MSYFSMCDLTHLVDCHILVYGGQQRLYWTSVTPVEELHDEEDCNTLEIVSLYFCYLLKNSLRVQQTTSLIHAKQY